MYHFNKIFAIALIVFLTGCSIGGEKKIKIFSVEQPREKLNHEMPTPLQMFKKLEEAGIDPVLFGITDKDFQVLARNFAQIRQKLQETNNLLQEYKKYYEDKDNGQD